MNRNIIAYSILTLLLFLTAPVSAAANDRVPVPGIVTMVDLGADKCIPCKMMAPILSELTKEYENKAAIIFIDVWKDKEQGRKFKIAAIPTQIFFDKEGNEVFRHQGFMSREAIIDQLQEMGITPPNQVK